VTSNAPDAVEERMRMNTDQELMQAAGGGELALKEGRAGRTCFELRLNRRT
jgi:hypothetical protein